MKIRPVEFEFNLCGMTDRQTNRLDDADSRLLRFCERA